MDNIHPCLCLVLDILYDVAERTAYVIAPALNINRLIIYENVQIFGVCTDIIVACPKFGQPALSSEFYNYALKTEIVAAEGMLLKK